MSPAQQAFGERRGKREMGESIRTGCSVHFSISRPVLHPDVLLVRWRADQQEHSGHDGVDAEQQPGGMLSIWPPWVSPEAKHFATIKLQLGVPPRRY